MADTRFARGLNRQKVTKQLVFQDNDNGSSGRRRTTRDAGRIDLTRMSSKEAMDLIDGVDPSTQSQNIEKVNDKKNRDMLKKRTEKNVNMKVVETNNIYDSNNDDSDSPQKNDQQASEKDKANQPNLGVKDQGKPNGSTAIPSTSSNSTLDSNQLLNGMSSIIKIKDQGKPNGSTAIPSTSSNSTLDSNQLLNGMSSIIKNNRMTNVGFHDSNFMEKSSDEKEQEENSTKEDRENDLDHIFSDIDENFDKTLPASMDQASQTDASFVSTCSCTKCASIFTSFEELLIKHQLSCKGKEVTVSNPNARRLGLNISGSSLNIGQDESAATNEDEEKLVPLVKGCPKVMIGISKKAALPSEVPNLDPRGIIHYILGSLYNTVELAQLTCDGKTKIGKKLDPDVAAILQVYVKAKMDRNRYDFNKQIFKSCCNEKFYKARLWVWNNRPDLVASGVVRAKLAKNVKKDKKDGDDNASSSKPKPKPVKRRSRYEKEDQPRKEHRNKDENKREDQPRKEHRKEYKNKDENKSSRGKEKQERKGTKEIVMKKRNEEECKNKRMEQEKEREHSRHATKKDRELHSTKAVHKTKQTGKEHSRPETKEKEKECTRPIVGNKRPKPMSADVLAKVKKFSTSTPQNKKKYHESDDDIEDDNNLIVSDENGNSDSSEEDFSADSNDKSSSAEETESFSD